MAMTAMVKPHNLGQREILWLLAKKGMRTMKYGKLELGQIEALVNIIGGMEIVTRILQGTMKVVLEIVKHLIDMDAGPYVPDGWKVESHKKGGQLEWDSRKVQLYLSKEQQGEKYIEGNKLRKELETQPVYNANMLDYLLAHTDLIPEEWKGKYIFFWGTIFRGAGGDLCVRDLYFMASPGAGTMTGLSVTSTPAAPPSSLASNWFFVLIHFALFGHLEYLHFERALLENHDDFSKRAFFVLQY